MYVLPCGHGQRLPAIIGGEDAVALGLEIDLQGGDDVFFVVNDKNGIHGGLLWLSIYSTTSYLFYSYRASPQFFSMGVGTALRRTEWWMGFHSTFIKSAANEMGRYVSMNRGKVRV